jgi:hypothetical protein
LAEIEQNWPKSRKIGENRGSTRNDEATFIPENKNIKQKNENISNKGNSRPEILELIEDFNDSGE